MGKKLSKAETYITIFGILGSIILIGIILTFFYFAGTRQQSTKELLMIFGGPCFLVTFLMLGVFYFYNKKRFKGDGIRLAENKKDFLKLFLIFGITFVLLLVAVFW